MEKSGKTPIRRAPINNKGILYVSPAPRLDRIQLSVKKKGGNYNRLKMLFKEKADSLFSFPLSGDRRGEACTVRWQGKKITMRFEGGYYFRITLSQPDETVQKFVRDIVLEGTKNNSCSLTQVEFALDYYSSNKKQLKQIERYLARYFVMKGLRANGTDRYQKKGSNSTFYQGNGGDVRKGDKGLTIYAKDGRVFCRVELKAHHHFLNRQELTFESLPIAPDTLCVSDFCILRKMPSEKILRRLATLYADQRMMGARKYPAKRMEAMHRTARAVFLRKLESFVSEGKTVAEMVGYLKSIQKRYTGFKFVLDRAFPRIPFHDTKKYTIQIFPNYLGI